MQSSFLRNPVSLYSVALRVSSSIDGVLGREGTNSGISALPLLSGAFNSRDSPPTFSSPRSYYGDHSDLKMRGTTILCVRRDNKIVMIGDGQVSMGNAVVKSNMKKVRKIFDGVVAGFAGSTADAMALFDLLEAKLEATNGQLLKAAVDFAKDWRLQKAFGRLDATLIVADRTKQLQITGNGEVLESSDGILCVGSGSPYALAAARALIDIPGLDAMAIAKKSMRIAADTCVFTNDSWTIEELEAASEGEGEGQVGEKAVAK